MSAVINALPLPPVYYAPQQKTYWRRDENERWMQVNEDSARKFVLTQGYENQPLPGDQIKEVEQCLLHIQERQNVDYSGPLAGYDAGVFDINHRQILVTESPRLIVPAPGEWPVLANLLENLFNDPEHADQRPYLYGWLKQGLEGYYNKRFVQGQVLAIAGESDSGKSVFQNLLTKLFGGRSAHPYAYMTGSTAFNADLFRAEHLVIEDEAGSTDIRARRNFGAAIKKMAVNLEQYCHGKNKEALTLTPRWRVSVTLNNEVERVQILPPLDEDIADKIILLKARRWQPREPFDTSEEKGRVIHTLEMELPAFVDSLLHWEIPAELRSTRYGINHYHHPELVEALKETAPETRLLELIDRRLFQHEDLVGAWEGTAADLEQLLTADNSDVARLAEKLLRNANSCGGYLARLARTTERVAKRVLHGRTLWAIRPQG